MSIFRKHKEPHLDLTQLEIFNKLIHQYPAHSVHFPDGLDLLLKWLSAGAAAIFVFDGKSDMFLLKKWVGDKPSHFSISAELEFIKFLKVRSAPSAKSEFLNKSHELRQSALYFFQQTDCDRVYPILNDGNWLGMITVQTGKTKLSMELFDQMVMMYGRHVERHILYDSVFRKFKKLHEVKEVKNELMSNVTHEFQTPLNGILGLAEGLLDGMDGNLSDEARHHIAMIKKSGMELSDTLNNVLQLSQISAAKNKMRLEKTNLLNIVEEVAFLFQQPIREKELKCYLPDTKESFQAFVEPDQIRTVVMNLMSNAVKFTQKGSITVDLKKSGEMIHVSIQDTGAGIEEQKLDLIFEEFFQGDGTHTRQHGGTGIGLALVKKIIDLHGGRIWVDSQVGYGTRVTFSLPVFPV